MGAFRAISKVLCWHSLGRGLLGGTTQGELKLSLEIPMESLVVEIKSRE